MGNTSIQAAVKEERWEKVETLLKKRRYNRKDIDEFIASSEAVNNCYVSDDIVAHFSPGQQNRCITAAVKNDQWQAAGRMLKFCEDSDTRAWVIEEASKRVDDDDFDSYIMPHCSGTEKELRQGVHMGHWMIVGYILAKGVRCALDRWAVEEASKRAGGLYFQRFILPHCSEDQIESVLKHLVTRGMWMSIGKVLERGVSDTQRRWAVQEACKQELPTDLDFERYILPHCSDDQLESVLKYLITRGMWRSVGNVLRRGVGDILNRWAVEEASERANDRDVELYILPHCYDGQLEVVLKDLVTRCMWVCVGKVLKRGVSDTLYRWAVEEASKRADDDEFDRYILPHCSDTEKEMRNTVQKGHWTSVGEMLATGVRCALDRWAVEEASKRDNGWHFQTDILPHCSDDQLGSVLTHLVTRCMWEFVGKVLERGVSDTHRLWAFEEACKQERFTNYCCELYILPHLSDYQLESVLKHLVTQGMWVLVGKVLERGVIDAHRLWAFEEACKQERFTNYCCELYILPHLSDYQLESVLKHLVTQGMWESVGYVLKRGVSDTQRRWAVEEACKQESPTDFDFELYIMPHLSDDQLESVLKHLVPRCMWMSVGKVLERGVSDTQYRWAVEEASKRDDDDAFDRYILPHCSDTEKELRNAVQKGHWTSVGEMLATGVRCVLDRWAVEEASERANDNEFEQYILPHCKDGQLEVVLKHLQTRCMWLSIGKVLERGVSDTLYRWAVEEASKRADDDEFDRYILPHCSDTEKELRKAVQKDHWTTVGEMLATGVRCALDRWAVEEASKRANGRHFETDILPHSRDDQLESVLKHLVTRCMWEIVGKVLERGVSDTQSMWAFQEACKQERFTNYCCELYILPHLSDYQLESVLKHLVTQGMWVLVGKVLERGVIDAQRRWVVQEACKKEGPTDLDFEHFILPYCSDDHLEFVLKQLVTRSMWLCVGKVLERGVDGTLYRWALKEASRRANDSDFEQYILPHCNYGQLEVVLKELVGRCMWQSTGKVLGRGVSDTQRSWAFEVASKRASDLEFKQYIIPPCNDDQLKSLLKPLVTQCLFASCKMIKKRGVKLHTLLLSEMCRICGYNNVMGQIKTLGQDSMELLIRGLSSGQLATHVKNVALRFALHQNKWGVIRKVSLSDVWEQVRRELFRVAVEQRRWSLVKKWADHTVYDNQRWWAQEQAYKNKQWDVMLQLTDYGMTGIELMRVRYRLAKYADWDVVVRMIERGVDVTEVREVVESVMISRKTARDESKRRALVVRWHQLRQLEDYYTKASCGRVRKWSLVLFYLHRHHRHRPSLQQLLQRAIKDEAWHVVRHLLRLGLDTAQRDSLLREMISRHQWGVCRVLLEQGVSVLSCLEALPLLMDSDQWTLVARVMEYNVGDDCRQRVMRRAMERREGSVVWRCITTMQHYRLSRKKRETLFQLAMSGGVWEVVKPLMEELDSTGLQHRDTALLEAIEQHQWDVVDYCQWHKADINMKDRNRQTPLNRAGRKGDWKAVKELVIRGGDPNVPDIDKRCILNIVIRSNKWYLTRLIIEYHGHIHVVDDFGSTPLQFLIDKRKGEIIHQTLMWCLDQSKVVNWKGETTLHAIALDKRPELMYSQIVRGVNPLTLTKDGQSVLLYAVQNPHSAQRMVAQCIKLDFGTHQPQLNVQMLVEQLYTNVLRIILHKEWTRPTPSPLLFAVVHGQHVVAHMLYESGSCSNTQLLQLYTLLYKISDTFLEHGRGLLEDISRQRVEKQSKFRARYEVLMKTITTFLPYLREMATKPRSLVSTCRLVISHHLVVRGRRERDVQQLPLTDRMKNYVLFSDLADPDYAWYLHGRLPLVPKESDSDSDSSDSDSD